MRIEFNKEFACTPERLWLFLSEPERQKLWMKGLLENQPANELHEQVGATFRMKIKEGRTVAEYDGKITAYDRPHQLGVDLSGGNFPPTMVMHVNYRLTDLSGRTRLDYAAAMECSQPLPWWMRLLMPLIRLFGTMQLKGFMKTLQRLAEQPDS